MRYTDAGKLSRRLSVICMGSIQLCAMSREEAFALLDSYRESGGNFLDSANVYGKWLPEGKNLADEYLGAWMKSRGCRAEMIVAGKGGHPSLQQFDRSRLSKEDVEADLDESLRTMGCGEFDLFYLHRDDPERPVEEIADYLDGFVRAGKIRAYGVSNWSTRRLSALYEYAERAGKALPAANQLLWNCAVADPAHEQYIGMQRMEKDTLQFHRDTQMLATAYESQARGYFQKWAAKGAESLPEEQKLSYPPAKNEGRFQRICRLAEETGSSVSGIVLGYLFQHGFPSCAVVGSRTPAQLADTLKAGDVSLTKEQIAFLEGDA